MTVRPLENGPDDWVRGIPRVLKSDAEEVEAAWKALPDSEEARTEFLKTHDRRFRDIEEVWEPKHLQNDALD